MDAGDTSDTRGVNAAVALQLEKKLLSRSASCTGTGTALTSSSSSLPERLLFPCNLKMLSTMLLGQLLFSEEDVGGFLFLKAKPPSCGNGVSSPVCWRAANLWSSNNKKIP